MGDVVAFSFSGHIPEPTGDPYLDLVEMAIVGALSRAVEIGVKYAPAEIGAAKGISHARALYLDQHPDLDGGELDSEQYVSSLLIAIRKLGSRGQAKLRHPSRSRAEVQAMLLGGSR